MRLIDADEFLERFNRKSDVWGALTDEETSKEFWLFCRVEDELEKTPTVTMDVNTSPVGGWISVKDRLPKSMINKALVWLEHEDLVGYIGFGHYEKYQGVEMWYDLEHQEPFEKHGYTVTHWMPLPEPPKGDEV